LGVRRQVNRTSEYASGGASDWLKRAFDLAVSLIGLIAVAPFLAVIGLMVRLDTPGPPFYSGLRVGRGGRPFRIYKIRTMSVEAEKQGPLITAADDPRITRLGRFLRRTKLDELPQLVNVLKGDMSLVGPRPETPEFVDLYTPEQSRVLSVRPGITGAASLVFSHEERHLSRSTASSVYVEQVLPGKLAIELAYLDRRSFGRDFHILASTLVLLFPRHLVEFRRVSQFIRRRLPWMLIDGPVVAVAFYLAIVLRFIDSPRGLLQAVAEADDWIVPVIVLYVAVNYLFGLHRRAWRYAGAADAVALMSTTAVSTAIAVVADIGLAIDRQRPMPLSVVLLGGFFTLTGFAVTRYRGRFFSRVAGRRTARRESSPASTRTLIYGAGDVGQVLVARLLEQKAGRAYDVVGFVDDDRSKKGLLVHGIKILGNRAELRRLVERHKVDLIVVAIAHLAGDRLRAILSVAQETTAQIRMAPDVFEWMRGSTGAPLLREVEVQDMLGRPPVTMNVPGCTRLIGNKVVLVTGACGSIGQELCRQVRSFVPEMLVMVDNNETGLYDLDIELSTRFPHLNRRVVVADVTDEHKMNAVFQEFGPHLVFHAAAYKHVPLMEQFPDEAVRVNVWGTLITLTKAQQNGAQRFVLVSTDKAVNPTSVMGATKRIAEMLAMSHSGSTTGAVSSGTPSPGMLCTAVRFGNVLGSRGSVVPTFAKQIELGGPVTVTHRDMTRYFMDVSEAARLIIQAAVLTTGADIFMLDMGERIRIDDLARKMIRLRGLRPEVDIPITYTGARPGEKLHEELSYAYEETQSTQHPSIRRSIGPNARADGAADIREVIDALLFLATTTRREELTNELLRVSQGGRLKHTGTLVSNVGQQRVS
jgi:FlaA1/EpsC-like NDP-sugar epimerase/lipopolysaccharide/colanic/teichoic acid biosynthesis glycosyltransferase